MRLGLKNWIWSRSSFQWFSNASAGHFPWELERVSNCCSFSANSESLAPTVDSSHIVFWNTFCCIIEKLIIDPRRGCSSTESFEGLDEKLSWWHLSEIAGDSSCYQTESYCRYRCLFYEVGGIRTCCSYYLHIVCITRSASAWTYVAHAYCCWSQKMVLYFDFCVTLFFNLTVFLLVIGAFCQILFL